MIPGWLLEKLRSAPKSGAGVHAWLYSTARQLHAHMGPDESLQRLRGAVAFCGRRVTDREIQDAVQNSLGTAWIPDGGRYKAPLPAVLAVSETQMPEKWPKASLMARAAAVCDGRGQVPCLADLWERSPVRWPEAAADMWVDTLFPGAESDWICAAKGGPETAETRRRGDWGFDFPECQFVVPSLMTKRLGARLDGKGSVRCLGNTGPRCYLVVEFDSGEINEQASLLWHLELGSIATGGPRLALALHSGGKSLHGWFLAGGRSEEDLRSWMAYAVRIGADHATFTRCQLVRMPEGKRVSVRQSVFYFNSDHLWTPALSLPLSEPSGSPPMTHPMGSSVAVPAGRDFSWLKKRQAAAAG